ncbi:MAG: NAD(P)-dependent oxidoreductase [Candidatus Binataceae bacterium]
MANEVGFVGLGNMGLPMAQALMAAGMKLTVYNRTASKADPLINSGAKLAASAAETASSGGIAVTMVSDDPTLEAMTIGDDGIAARLSPDGIHVSMTTVSPMLSRRLAEVHRARGSIYVAAPVFGRPDRAQARKLFICASGPTEAKKRIRPLLEAIGQKTFDFGEEPGAANVVKLMGNFMIMSALEAISEGLALAERNGLDRFKVAEMFTSTLFASPMYQNYFDTIVNRRFIPAGFRMPLGLKDAELVLSTARESRVPMPAASVVRDRFIAGLAHGRDEMDWAAIALSALDAAALKP